MVNFYQIPSQSKMLENAQVYATEHLFNENLYYYDCSKNMILTAQIFGNPFISKPNELRFHKHHDTCKVSES